MTPDGAGPGPRVLAGRYRLIERLGRGAFGEVWRAEDTVLGERVAVKRLLHAGAASPGARREIAALRMLRLPGVVRLLDEGMEEDGPFLVMDHVEGRPFPGASGGQDPADPALADTPQLGTARTLPATAPTLPGTHLALPDAAFLRTEMESAAGAAPPAPPVAAARRPPAAVAAARKRRPWAAIAGPAMALLETLARVHAAGLVHRDLKPENVLVRADGCPVVLDFGLALEHLEGVRPGMSPEAGGTPAYASPEQIRRQPIDARSDLYSVGVMLFEALAGSLPHEAPTVQGVFFLRLSAPADPVADRAPGVPPHVARVVDELLAREPDDRPRSAADVLARLRDGSAPAWPQAALSPVAPSAPPAAVAPSEPPHPTTTLLDRRVLRSLFAGPDRLFHLREDAASALWSRTGGDPSRVAAELAVWVRAGLARWDGPQLAIQRDALDRLEDDPEAVLGAHAAGADDPVGAVRQAHASRAAALEPGDPGRLYFLIAAGQEAEAAAESLVTARRLAEMGALGRATAALHEGLLAARRAAHDGHVQDQGALLSEWVKVAFAERTTKALDRVLYELCRSNDVAVSARLQGLVRAALIGDGQGWRERVRSETDALGPFDDPELERWRHWVRVRAAIRESPEAAESAVDEVEAWAEVARVPVARAAAAGWRGLVLYEKGKFEEAAAAHAEAARQEPWLPLRIASTLNEANALMEAFQPERAAARALEAQELAARCRHPYFEARAEWVRRTAAYRMGEVSPPDMDLVAACEALGATDYVALVCFTEATFARRSGDRAAAVDLASRALDAWRRIERRWPALLAECFIAYVRGSLPEEEARALLSRADKCPVAGLAVQLFAMIRRACPSSPRIAEDVLARCCEGIPEARWDMPLDVLSVRASLEIARGAAAVSAGAISEETE